MYEGPHIRIWFPVDISDSPAVIAAEAGRAAMAQNYAEQHNYPFDRVFNEESISFVLFAPLGDAKKVVSDLSVANISHGNIDVLGTTGDDEQVAVLRVLAPDVFVSVITGEGNDHRHDSQ